MSSIDVVIARRFGDTDQRAHRGRGGGDRHRADRAATPTTNCTCTPCRSTLRRSTPETGRNSSSPWTCRARWRWNCTTRVRRWPPCSCVHDRCSRARPRRIHRPSDPVHVRADRRELGADRSPSWSLAFAWRTPQLDPDSPGHRLPGWVTRFADAPIDAERAGGVGLVFAAWVALAAVFGPSDPRECPAGRVLRAALGGTGRGVAGVRTGVASTLPGPHAAPIGAARLIAALPDGRHCAVPQRAGGTGPRSSALFAFVWLELASGDPGSRCRGAYLAAGATSWSRRSGPSTCGDALVRAGRSVRGVQHAGVAVVVR